MSKFYKQNCNITEIKEFDILYQVRYNRYCEHCGYLDSKERRFTSVMKNGKTGDIDNWHCPKCNQLNETKIVIEVV